MKSQGKTKSKMKIYRRRHFNSKFNLKVEKMICASYQEGLSSTRIANCNNCSTKTILRVLKFNKIKIRRSGPPNNTLTDFWKYVKKRKNKCWEWVASTDADGYGAYLHTRAHRFSYQLKNGVIPDLMSVCHTCDNPTCVNPAHLFLGTTQDNNKDCVDKQRNAFGEKSGKSKLTEKEVIQIRKLFKTTNRIKLSEIFGVHKDTISAIIHRKTWKYL